MATPTHPQTWVRCSIEYLHCNTLQHTATHCNTLQHTVTYCNTLQHTATHTVAHSTAQTATQILKRQLTAQLSIYTATHCNTLQHTATSAIHCNTLQHTAKHCNILQHTATHCNTLQHTATHCNTLQHTATHCNILQHTATYCNTLQHTATHCNMLQHTAVSLLNWCTMTKGSQSHQTDVWEFRTQKKKNYCSTDFRELCIHILKCQFAAPLSTYNDCQIDHAHSSLATHLMYHDDSVCCSVL